MPSCLCCLLSIALSYAVHLHLSGASALCSMAQLMRDLERGSAHHLETLGGILSWTDIPKIIMQHWSIFVKKPYEDYQSTTIHSQECILKALVLPMSPASTSQPQNMKLKCGEKPFWTFLLLFSFMGFLSLGRVSEMRHPEIQCSCDEVR